MMLNIKLDNLPNKQKIEKLIDHAFKLKASDIHIEPFKETVRVRFRIDGSLYLVSEFSTFMSKEVVSVVKVMASLDIAEKRIPQDGKIAFKLEENEIDIRVSVIPTVHGEKIVLRLLSKLDSNLNIGKIGLTEKEEKLVKNLISKPQGMILVTGPTGSGKTTTIYSILNELNSVNKNITTIEDPIEYEVEGVNQTQVNHKIDLDFAKVLRSVLRQDPDIIVIGEIRDTETARIALKASLTGHLVLSTLHTNDAASAVVRLKDMGVEPYLISAALNLVIAQRLLRKLCPDCKKLSPDGRSYQNIGCEKCNDLGFKGRTGVFEILELNNEIKHEIDKNCNLNTIKELAVKNGMQTLFDSSNELIEKGLTTLIERNSKIGLHQ